MLPDFLFLLDLLHHDSLVFLLVLFAAELRLTDHRLIPLAKAQLFLSPLLRIQLKGCGKFIQLLGLRDFEHVDLLLVPLPYFIKPAILDSELQLLDLSQQTINLSLQRLILRDDQTQLVLEACLNASHSCFKLGLDMGDRRLVLSQKLVLFNFEPRDFFLILLLHPFELC